MTEIDLRNPGHVLLGARATGYPGIEATLVAGLNDHEQRIERQIHLGMNFARPGFAPLPGAKTVTWLRQQGAGLIQCWKPVERWADANGDDYDVNRYLTRCAAAVGNFGAPVLMIVHHEPENDVGKAGTAADYRIMWAHVRRVFDDVGVDNVTWGMGYMNYPKWDSLIGELWPTQADPEWIFFNAYGSVSRPDYGNNVSRFYQGLEEEQWFASKAKLWGVREWSVKGLDGHAAHRYFEDARLAAEKEMFPKLRAHVVFDSLGKENLSEMRIGYTVSGFPDRAKAAAYAAFAHSPMFGPVIRPV